MLTGLQLARLFCFSILSFTRYTTLVPQNPSKAAEGYPDNATVLRKTTSVADFVTGDDHFQVLGSSHALEFDRPSEVFAKHPDTNSEIKELCKDIKVLGPRLGIDIPSLFPFLPFHSLASLPPSSLMSFPYRRCKLDGFKN